MGLTTNPRFRSGASRTEIPNPASVGLRGSGYLWGNRLTAISVMDVDRHLGWVDADLAAAIIVNTELATAEAAALIRAVVGDTAAA